MVATSPLEWASPRDAAKISQRLKAPRLSPTLEGDRCGVSPATSSLLDGNSSPHIFIAAHTRKEFPPLLRHRRTAPPKIGAGDLKRLSY
ncbi:Hypothetical predicted protein [Olea europaea subsp. europaea]|uniref:Uncharacterized protein n=1 Tax=Olea europaea subsp. europaea TaxID=158383 RepID=A0A8S0R9N7_OLEEU|nr:Hypothetical predicted protein [Olea europaea subsp. europaea]